MDFDILKNVLKPIPPHLVMDTFFRIILRFLGNGLIGFGLIAFGGGWIYALFKKPDLVLMLACIVVGGFSLAMGIAILKGVSYELFTALRVRTGGLRARGIITKVHFERKIVRDTDLSKYHLTVAYEVPGENGGSQIITQKGWVFKNHLRTDRFKEKELVDVLFNPRKPWQAMIHWSPPRNPKYVELLPLPEETEF